MIRFTMDRKDCGTPIEEILAAGYELDNRYNRSMDFIGFIHRGVSPKTKQEAFAFMRKTFFFPPVRIWIDGKEVK